VLFRLRQHVIQKRAEVGLDDLEFARCHRDGLWKVVDDLGAIEHDHRMANRARQLGPQTTSWPGLSTSKAELLAVADVILGQGSSITSALQQATTTVPVVFVNVADPVGAGFVDSLSRPGGNITGFMNFEYGISGKWLELLKEIVPRMSRAGVLRDPTIASGSGQLGAIQSVAPGLGVELYPINVRDPAEIERGITGFVRSTDDGLIVTASPLAAVHRKLIVMLARRHRVPAIYWERTPVHDGGLISYGADLTDQFGRAAGYVDRILKGEKPADLPVQAPTKYELVLNMKTAKALGIEIPPTLLARADEVIE
jgi:putative ABC transport system substrate-binding protein